MTVWIGMYLAVLPSLVGSSKLWALTSPLYIIGLLMFASGVPILEKSAQERWGKDADFKKYKQEVPVLVPSVVSLKRLFK